MQVAIIHRPERTDRESNLCELLRFFKDVRVTNAIVLSNLTGNDSALAIRGCAASHLQAFEQSNPHAPILILEDDAKIDEKLYRYVQSLGPAPKDCGAVILGADGLPEAKGPWNELTDKYYGSQAVLYFQNLRQTNFLTSAWKLLATTDINSKEHVCYESVLQQSVAAAGLKLYYPAQLPFTTIESYSDRTGATMPARSGVCDANGEPTTAEQETKPIPTETKL